MPVTEREMIVVAPTMIGEMAGSATAIRFGSTLNAAVAAGGAAVTGYFVGRYVYIKANTDNAGNVYVGLSASVTKSAGTSSITAGLPIDAGQGELIPLPGGDAANLFFICDNAGDDFGFMILG